MSVISDVMLKGAARRLQIDRLTIAIPARSGCCTAAFICHTLYYRYVQQNCTYSELGRIQDFRKEAGNFLEMESSVNMGLEK